MNKNTAIRLLVISNVLVAFAAILPGLAIFLHYDLVAYIGSGLALAGACFAVWQGLQADGEQKQFVKDYVKIQEDLKQAKQRSDRMFILIFSVGIIIGVIIRYWLHPEKRPKQW